MNIRLLLRGCLGQACPPPSLSWLLNEMLSPCPAQAEPPPASLQSPQERQVGPALFSGLHTWLLVRGVLARGQGTANSLVEGLCLSHLEFLDISK